MASKWFVKVQLQPKEKAMLSVIADMMFTATGARNHHQPRIGRESERAAHRRELRDARNKMDQYAHRHFF